MIGLEGYLAKAGLGQTINRAINGKHNQPSSRMFFRAQDGAMAGAEQRIARVIRIAAGEANEALFIQDSQQVVFNKSRTGGILL